MVKFVVDETGERVFTCADDRDAEDKVRLLRSEGRVAYIAANPETPGNGTWLRYDPELDVVIIDGSKFARQAFVDLDCWGIGQAFRITQRVGEVVALEPIKHADILEIEQTHAQLQALEHLIAAAGVNEGESPAAALERILAEAVADKLELITKKESPAPADNTAPAPQGGAGDTAQSAGQASESAAAAMERDPSKGGSVSEDAPE